MSEGIDEDIFDTLDGMGLAGKVLTWLLVIGLLASIPLFVVALMVAATHIFGG